MYIFSVNLPPHAMSREMTDLSITTIPPSLNCHINGIILYVVIFGLFFRIMLLKFNLVAAYFNSLFLFWLLFHYMAILQFICSQDWCTFGCFQLWIITEIMGRGIARANNNYRFSYLFIYWCILALQCFRCISKWFRYISICVYLFRFFSIILYYKIMNIVSCSIQ